MPAKRPTAIIAPWLVVRQHDWLLPRRYTSLASAQCEAKRDEPTALASRRSHLRMQDVGAALGR
ncbi:MAG TPA: hypothetical protein VGK55_02090 [Actinomycetes bacterium]